MSTIVSGVMQTYDRTGEKEDIEDLVYRIDREETPFLSSIGKVKVTNRLHQWQVRELAAPNSTPVLEGAPVGTASGNDPVMLGAYTQIFKGVAEVSGTTQAVPAYGRGNELAEQELIKGVELRKNQEYACIGANQGSSSSPAATTAGNDAKGTARALTSAQNLVDSSTSNTNSSNRNLNRSFIDDVFKKTFNAGGKPNMLMVSPNHAFTVASFAVGQNATGNVQRDMASNTTLVNSVDIYRTPLGQIKVVPNYLIDPGTCLMLDTKYWKRGVLRPVTKEKMAKGGDTEKSMIISEMTLICNAPKSSGVINKLNA